MARVCFPLAATAAVVLALAAPAQAQSLEIAFVSMDDDLGLPSTSLMQYDASRITAGHSATMRVDSDRKGITISDPGVQIRSLSTRCTGGMGTARCRSSETINRIDVTLGPGADRWTSPGFNTYSEHIDGGSARDILHGSARNSELVGGAGNDSLTIDTKDPFPGLAQINGGDGTDHLVYRDSGRGYLHGGAGNDLIEAAATGVVMGGDAGNDRLLGTPGGDFLIGGTGSDEIRGGGGVDTASYAGHADSVNVTLDGIRNDGAPGENDLLDSIENVEGLRVPSDPPGGDSLTGDAGANFLHSDNAPVVLRALGGDDRLESSADGALLEGGDGNDTFQFAWDGLKPTGTLDGGAGNDAFYVQFVNHTSGGPSRSNSTALITAGDGDDVIYAGDELPEDMPDNISCGEGTDTVTADPEDTVAADCENVTYPDDT